ncbi:MAG: hypothetical protein M1823_003646 [Watsoniomyces obsoletus]|nr:MAG: hypothetical protein M1823_003646 [Watsoniomyces obsoletus]
MVSPIVPLPEQARSQIQSSSKIRSVNDVVLGLLENSLDAGASKIHVEADYARRGCTIEDNGLGIPVAEFREDGGLGKLYHTSRYGSEVPRYGQNGTFLASLASLSLLSITSHHHQQDSHSSLTMHQSAVIARRIPAPSHYNLSYQAHGTRISVKDLFGNMPVRVKHLALADEHGTQSVKDWRTLTRSLVGLLLAWGRPVGIVIRETGSGQKLTLRWPQSIDGSILGETALEAKPATSSRIFSSLLMQALQLPLHFKDSWVPLSASSSTLVLEAIVSSMAAPSRRTQFIALGIQPFQPETEHNILHEEVNALFTASTFGNVEGPSVVDADERQQFKERGRNQAWFGRDVRYRGKGVDRWPVFFVRINAQHGMSREKFRTDTAELSSSLAAAVVDLLRATFSQFLKEHGFLVQPLHSTSTARILPESPASRPAPQSRASESARLCQPGSGTFVSPFMTPRPQSAIVSSMRGNSLRVPLRSRRPRTAQLQVDDLGGGVKLPVFGREGRNALDEDFTSLRRTKSSRGYEGRPGTLAKHAVVESAKAQDGASKVPQSPDEQPDTERPRNECDGAVNAGPETAGLGDGRPPTAVAGPMSVVPEEMTSAPVQLAAAIVDEELAGFNPVTGTPFRINCRTGNVIPTGPKKLLQSVLSRRTPTHTMPLRTVVNRQGSCSAEIPTAKEASTSTPWLQDVLVNWENPVFKPTERAIPQVSTDHASNNHASTDLGTHSGCSFALDGSFKDIRQNHRYKLSRSALSGAHVISQFDGKFILVKVVVKREDRRDVIDQRKEILVAIDQHAADERCRIEELLAELCMGPSGDDQVQSTLGYQSSIKTMILGKPIEVRIKDQEARLYQKHAAYFARWGILYDFDTELRDHRAKSMLLVKTIPPGIAERSKGEPQLLSDLLRREIWARDERGSRIPTRTSDAGFATPIDDQANTSEEGLKKQHGWMARLKDCPQGILDMLSSRACRSAIMFNDRLPLDDCTSLVSRLSTCALPFQCAHGRPTMVPLVDVDVWRCSNTAWSTDSLQARHAMKFGSLEIDNDGARANNRGFVDMFNQWDSQRDCP